MVTSVYCQMGHSLAPIGIGGGSDFGNNINTYKGNSAFFSLVNGSVNFMSNSGY